MLKYDNSLLTISFLFLGSPSNLQFTLTRFGEKLLKFDNNIFCQKMISKSHWYCTNIGCKFEMIIENDTHITEFRGEHNHETNEFNVPAIHYY